MATIIRKTIQMLNSPKAFYLALGIFAAQAVWYALSAVYPAAFDEEVHLGITKIYAHQWGPFFSSQPDGANAFGPVVRDPSYLYHYLMSFPYRLLTDITHNAIIQIVAMRFINIALFGAGLVVVWRLLRQMRLPMYLTHLAMLFFVLTPLVPQLAGQINYDNLFFLVVAAALKLTVDLVQQIRRGDALSVPKLLILASLCLLGSLVKYAFLPAVLAIVLLLVWGLRGRKPVPLVRQLWQGFRGLSPVKRVGLAALLLLALGLFIQMYGVNTLRYGSPVPGCEKVLDIDSCMEYSPWARNYKFAHDVTIIRDNNILIYSVTWIWFVMRSFFFAINGPASGYYVGEPLPILLATAYTVLIAGIVFVSMYGRKIWRAYPELAGVMAIGVVYMVILWHHNFSEFKEIGMPVAISGRYLVPFLLFAYIVLALAFSMALRRRPRMKMALAGVCLAVFLTQGGLVTFLEHSDNGWLWPNPTVRSVNSAARDVLTPFAVRHIP